MKSALQRAVRAFAVLAAFSAAVPAGAAYISGSAVNCRARPDAKAPVVAKLHQGQEVSVMEAGGGWSRLASPSCWVSSRFISTGYVAQAYSTSSRTSRSSSARSSSRQSANSYSFYNQTPKLSRPYRKRKAASSKRRSSGSGIYSGAGCPCRGGTVCIGPRGGRYCITSGGNKRYGV